MPLFIRLLLTLVALASSPGLQAGDPPRPFSRIQAWAGTSLLAEAHGNSAVTAYEYDLDAPAAVSHIVVKPTRGVSGPFSIEARAVTVMRCDYEGPHLELDSWKQGLSAPRPLRRQGQRFLVDAGILSMPMPAFPHYTSRELRRAIRDAYGETGLASTDETQTCAPFLRGHRFTVRHQGAVVHTLLIYQPGGC
ncbi:MAG: hypothetical protein PHI64_18745 [Zoogloea sp.]|uniref:hypothetical protein n=1 Tax=Zoogloea sp. TaxID=49181 RepID=UPI00260F6EC2|nr:hypothetical protein [Zoogloea sp.]MDD2990980.1 hypothetical protein [Zoogloea sp.]